MTKNYIHRVAALALSAASFTVLAHGDEPHGAEPHPVAGAVAGASRFEATTDAFEVVGRLEGEGLTLFINRFETNEPVLRAMVELELGAIKAVAEPQPDQGSYVVKDKAFVTALNEPGAHPIIVTLTVGDEADLLEGTLTVANAPGGRADETRTPVPVMAGALGVAVLVVGAVGAFALRRRPATKGETK